MDQYTDLYGLTTALVLSIGLLAGLGGSVHCTGMCGGLVMALTKNKKEISLYHIGRLLGYLSIGLIIPMLGIEVFNLKDNKTLSLITGIMLGLTFIYIGLKSLLKWKISSKFHSILERINSKVWRGLINSNHSGLIKSFLGGLSSVFLPCGLLWAVIVLSLTAQSPLIGGLFIFAFWAGTTPALSFSPVIIKKLILPLQNKVPTLGPALFIIIGVTTVGHRLYNMYTASGAAQCH